MNGDIASVQNNRIIIAPLNWGLGHATRCIPMIKQLLSQNNEIIIASDGESLELLKEEFPKVVAESIPSYDITYSYSSMMVNMLTQSKKILAAIYNEGKAAKTLVRKHNIDLLISDNRLGFYASGVTNIYVTHQLHIPHRNPLLSAVANRLHHHYISKFDFCWVPDYQGKESLAGMMVEKRTKPKQFFLGPQSRMVSDENVHQDIDYLIILSGPEPQRSILEEKLIDTFYDDKAKNIVLVRGTNILKPLLNIPTNITVYERLTTTHLNILINRAKMVVCRSGYTSVMDLVALGKSAILIPTPGQYEQEYIARRLDGLHGFRSYTQEEICRQLFYDM